jgi:5'-3' exoribonuclease 2
VRGAVEAHRPREVHPNALAVCVHVAQIKVVLSDARVPGEGEHKIMNYIRLQRTVEGYDPNMVHCIYGMVRAAAASCRAPAVVAGRQRGRVQDADLIMLGLATHEANFHIIREMVVSPDSRCAWRYRRPRCRRLCGAELAAGRTCFICGQVGHISSECKGACCARAPSPASRCLTLRQARRARRSRKRTRRRCAPSSSCTFQCCGTALCCARANALHALTWAVAASEYLAHYLAVSDLPFEWNLERVIDDWVFLCFFVGNDFLPHLPSLGATRLPAPVRWNAEERDVACDCRMRAQQRFARAP